MNIQEYVEVIKNSRSSLFYDYREYLKSLPTIKKGSFDYFNWQLNDDELTVVFSLASMMATLYDVNDTLQEFKISDDNSEESVCKFCGLFEAQMDVYGELIAVYIVNGGDEKDIVFTNSIDAIGSLGRIFYGEVRSKFNIKIAA